MKTRDGATSPPAPSRGALHNLRHALFLAPAAVPGIVLARPIGRYLDVTRTRNAAMALAVTGAAMLFVQQFG